MQAHRYDGVASTVTSCHLSTASRASVDSQWQTERKESAATLKYGRSAHIPGDLTGLPSGIYPQKPCSIKGVCEPLLPATLRLVGIMGESWPVFIDQHLTPGNGII